MEKIRVKKGEKYWYIDCVTRVCTATEYNEDIDNELFNKGNYFNTKEEAESIAKKLRLVLKGADVFEMSSDEEIEDMVQEYTQEITCGGHDRVYAVDGNGHILADTTYEEISDYLRIIIEKVKSKIVK